MTTGLSYEVRPFSAVSRDFFKEIWFFRRLVWLFIWRDIVVRYKNTLIGAAWYIIQPLAMMVVFTLFFGGIFGRYIGDLPYSVFAYSGLLLWQLFSRSMALGATSLVLYAPMLSKIYFPRIIVPASVVIGALFDFFLTALLLAAMLVYWRIPVGWALLAVPLILLFTQLFSMGCSCLLAAIDARYRDIRHAIPLLVQVWMFCTPVMYPVSYVPEKWQLLYAINPMVGLTQAFRWAIFQSGDALQPVALLLAASLSVLVFILGVVVFQKMQGTLVDTL